MSSLWHRIAADPALVDDVRRRYAGRGDAMDVLWWAEHPGTAAPSGAEDPADALERDRRALYRAGPAHDPAPVAAAAAAHRADREAATAAALAALNGRGASDVPEPGAVTAVEEAPGEQAEEASAPPAGRRVPLAAAAAVGVAALLVGLAVGAAGTSPLTARPAPSATVPAFRVFAREQRPALDVPGDPDAVPSALDGDSLRRLRSYSSIGTVLFAARTRDGRVCLLAEVLSAATAPACTSEAAFAVGGLTLILEASADPVDDSGRRPVEQLDLVWNPDDTVSITPVVLPARSPTAAAP